MHDIPVIMFEETHTYCYNASIMGRGHSAEVEGVRKYLRREKIRGGIWDADDNLFDTNTLFERQMSLFERSVLRKDPELVDADFHAVMKRVNKEVHETVGVCPGRWDVVIRKLSDELGIRKRPVLVANRQILMDIYRMVPRLLPGVISTLEIMHEALPDQAVNTHADPDWTHLKFRKLGLLPYFRYIHVAPVVKLKKDKWDWQKAAAGLQMAPESTMGVGDSVIADMWPAHEAGIPANHLVWTQSTWGYHSSNHAEPPSGTVVVNGVREIVPKFMELAA